MELLSVLQLIGERFYLELKQPFKMLISYITNLQKGLAIKRYFNLVIFISRSGQQSHLDKILRKLLVGISVVKVNIVIMLFSDTHSLVLAPRYQEYLSCLTESFHGVRVG